ncbi:hypothetical protein ABW19_dt0208056 [Dactylella cylindrospora]|nr:hypothetical protein ABW19_dt0208056 [Dactylella cylindrospora]
MRRSQAKENADIEVIKVVYKKHEPMKPGSEPIKLKSILKSKSKYISLGETPLESCIGNEAPLHQDAQPEEDATAGGDDNMKTVSNLFANNTEISQNISPTKSPSIGQETKLAGGSAPELGSQEIIKVQRGDESATEGYPEKEDRPSLKLDSTDESGVLFDTKGNQITAATNDQNDSDSSYEPQIETPASQALNPIKFVQKDTTQLSDIDPIDIPPSLQTAQQEERDPSTTSTEETSPTIDPNKAPYPIEEYNLWFSEDTSEEMSEKFAYIRQVVEKAKQNGTEFKKPEDNSNPTKDPERKRPWYEAYGSKDGNGPIEALERIKDRSRIPTLMEALRIRDTYIRESAEFKGVTITAEDKDKSSTGIVPLIHTPGNFFDISDYELNDIEVRMAAEKGKDEYIVALRKKMNHLKEVWRETKTEIDKYKEMRDEENNSKEVKEHEGEDEGSRTIEESGVDNAPKCSKPTLEVFIITEEDKGNDQSKN